MKKEIFISKSRVITYHFEGESFLDCEKILAKAKKDNIITNYDDGRDNDPWFEVARNFGLKEYPEP
jgi:hypothetical protein